MMGEAAVLQAATTLDIPALHVASLNLTALGSVTITAILVLILHHAGDRDTSLRLLTTSIIGGGTTLALKYLIARPRPDMASVATLTPSFPSGHATLAFGTAVILADRFDQVRHLFFLIASLVAATRITLGVHYPSDVVAGAAIGITAGIISTRYSDRIGL